jgi:aminopeptidase
MFGLRNIPDGEVYTAPVKTSVNGVITYNAPTLYAGTRFEKISLEVESGKIVKATSSAETSDRLNHILDTDAGARYFGEFALGVNPYILNPMSDILFDEKISGSLHFTRERPILRRIMGTAQLFIGIWYWFKDLSGGGERYGSMIS